MSNEKKNVIKSHATALVAGMLAESEALTGVVHPGHKGTCREILLADLLQKFLPSFLSLSTGIIVNSSGESLKEEQSNQTDIIIYDDRILPPFVQKGELGMVPVESVVGIIEVKTTLTKSELWKDNVDKDTGDPLPPTGIIPAAQRFNRQIPLVAWKLLSDKWWQKQAGKHDPIQKMLELLTPHMGVFAYRMEGLPQFKQKEKETVEQWGKRIATWCYKTLRPLTCVCVAREVCCINLQAGGWRPNGPQLETHEEVKRFIALILDNCRTRAERRYEAFKRGHVDWLSFYIRDQ